MSTGKTAQEAVAAASKAAKISGFKKYTVQPSGFWARLNKMFAIDPNRSTGVPLNATFRNPPPGANDPLEYEDAVTTPAADIAGNPYWKRDTRRSYPKQSFVKQPDVVALLSVGSKANPKEEVLQIGEAGNKQLVEVKEEGEKGLSAFFQKDSRAAKGVLDADGLPPFPASKHPQRKQYELLSQSQQSYGNRADGEMYPARSFT